MTTPSRPLTALILFLAALLATPIAEGQPPTYPPAIAPRDAGEPPPVPGPDDAQPDIAVPPRGPIHEAFAQPGDMAPRPGPVVPKKPPEPIPEVPPDQKPEGDNVQWIPGYWAWDADRKDFLWVSGLWRVPPPGRRWVPGAWNAVEGGYQWSPGLWAPAGQDDMPYLPVPPASLDNGPNSPPPDGDSFYVPGCWIYQSPRYLWRPGCWMGYRPGFVWTPSGYSWTPAGYLFSSGYWDYPLANRGLLFAPVFFNRPLWDTPGWCYRPSGCLPFSNGLLSALFVGPGRNGYYFGNYYGPVYQRAGFQPWFASNRGVANPPFSYYRWQNRNNPAWLRGLQTTFLGRSNGTLSAPASLVQPLGRLPGGALPLARLSPAQVQHQRNLAQQFQQFSVRRQNIERHGPRDARSTLSLGRVPASAAHAAPAHPHPPGTEVRHGVTLYHNAPAPHPAAVPHAAPVPHPAPVYHAPPAPVHHQPPAFHPAPPSHHAAGHGGGHGGGGHHR